MNFYLNNMKIKAMHDTVFLKVLDIIKIKPLFYECEVLSMGEGCIVNIKKGDRVKVDLSDNPCTFYIDDTLYMAVYERFII